MEDSGGRYSTTKQVQQDIDHFKEQYLHSLGLQTPRPATSPKSLSRSSSFVFSRRDSLSSVGTRRDSLSSASSQEDTALSTASSSLREDGFSEAAHRRESFPSAGSRRDSFSKLRMAAFDNDTGIHSDWVTPANTATLSPVDAVGRDRLKEEYIKSLGLTERPPKPPTLPSLKNRVNEFESLVARTSSKGRKTDYPKPSLLGLPTTRKRALSHPHTPTRQYNHNVKIGDDHSESGAQKYYSGSESQNNLNETPSKIDNRICANSRYSPEEQDLTDFNISTCSRRHIPIMAIDTHSRQSSPRSSEHYESSLSLSPPSSISLSPPRLHSPDKQLDSDDAVKIPRSERALSLGSRREIFEQLQQSSPTFQYSEAEFQRNKLRDFKVDPSVIQKAYTEKEKAFILQSFRKSGGREERTKNLGCSFEANRLENVSGNANAKLTSLSQAPGKLAQSLTKIVSRFENIDHDEPKGKEWHMAPGKQSVKGGSVSETGEPEVDTCDLDKENPDSLHTGHQCADHLHSDIGKTVERKHAETVGVVCGPSNTEVRERDANIHCYQSLMDDLSATSQNVFHETIGNEQVFHDVDESDSCGRQENKPEIKDDGVRDNISVLDKGVGTESRDKGEENERVAKTSAAVGIGTGDFVQCDNVHTLSAQKDLMLVKNLAEPTKRIMGAGDVTEFMVVTSGQAREHSAEELPECKSEGDVSSGFDQPGPEAKTNPVEVTSVTSVSTLVSNNGAHETASESLPDYGHKSQEVKDSEKAFLHHSVVDEDASGTANLSDPCAQPVDKTSMKTSPSLKDPPDVDINKLEYSITCESGISNIQRDSEPSEKNSEMDLHPGEMKDVSQNTSQTQSISQTDRTASGDSENVTLPSPGSLPAGGNDQDGKIISGITESHKSQTGSENLGINTDRRDVEDVLSTQFRDVPDSGDFTSSAESIRADNLPGSVDGGLRDGAEPCEQEGEPFLVKDESDNGDTSQSASEVTSDGLSFQHNSHGGEHDELNIPSNNVLNATEDFRSEVQQKFTTAATTPLGTTSAAVQNSESRHKISYSGEDDDVQTRFPDGEISSVKKTEIEHKEVVAVVSETCTDRTENFLTADSPAKFTFSSKGSRPVVNLTSNILYRSTIDPDKENGLNDGVKDAVHDNEDSRDQDRENALNEEKADCSDIVNNNTCFKPLPAPDLVEVVKGADSVAAGWEPEGDEVDETIQKSVADANVEPEPQISSTVKGSTPTSNDTENLDSPNVQENNEFGSSTPDVDLTKSQRGETKNSVKQESERNRDGVSLVSSLLEQFVISLVNTALRESGLHLSPDRPQSGQFQDNLTSSFSENTSTQESSSTAVSENLKSAQMRIFNSADNEMENKLGGLLSADKDSVNSENEQEFPGTLPMQTDEFGVNNALDKEVNEEKSGNQISESLQESDVVGDGQDSVEFREMTSNEKESDVEMLALNTDRTESFSTVVQGQIQFQVRPAYSEISGSVDSFNSVVSESADSFHSAEEADAVAEKIRDMNRTANLGVYSQEDETVSIQCEEQLSDPDGSYHTYAHNISEFPRTFGDYESGNPPVCSQLPSLSNSDARSRFQVTPKFGYSRELDMLDKSDDDSDEDGDDESFEECPGEYDVSGYLTSQDGNSLCVRGRDTRVDETIDEDDNDVFEDCVDVDVVLQSPNLDQDDSGLVLLPDDIDRVGDNKSDSMVVDGNVLEEVNHENLIRLSQAETGKAHDMKIVEGKSVRTRIAERSDYERENAESEFRSAMEGSGIDRGELSAENKSKFIGVPGGEQTEMTDIVLLSEDPEMHDSGMDENFDMEDAASGVFSFMSKSAERFGENVGGRCDENGNATISSRPPGYRIERRDSQLDTVFEQEEELSQPETRTCYCARTRDGVFLCKMCAERLGAQLFDGISSSVDIPPDMDLNRDRSREMKAIYRRSWKSDCSTESGGDRSSMERDSLDEEDVVAESSENRVDQIKDIHGSGRPRTTAAASKSATTDRGPNSTTIITTATTSTTTSAAATSSSSTQQSSSPEFPHYVESQNDSPPLCSQSLIQEDTDPVIQASSSEAPPPSDPVAPENAHASTINRPMTLGQDLGHCSSSNPQRAKSKVKEKRWREAEDADIGASNSSLKSPRKLNAPVHLDLAGSEMAELGDDGDLEQELMDSPGTSLHRISSAGNFDYGQSESSRPVDPYRMLERSQSDASLLRSDLEILGSDDEVHLTAAESSSGQNISECNRVYLDLSRAEAFERVELGDTAGAMMRTSSGRLLETIPQDEELKTGDLSYVYATHRSFSQESSSSVEDLTFSAKGKSKDGGGGGGSGSGGGGGGGGGGGKFKGSGKCGQDSNNSITSSKSNLRSSFQIYSHSLKQKVRQLQMGSVPEQVNALTELNVLMEQAWSMPIYGKDLAYELCDILRTESALDIIVSNLASSNRELMKVSARLLEQSLTTSNRRQVAENGLELVVKMTHDARGDCELAQTCTGILESLFKTSEETCAKVIKLGGLDTITYWCRCNDRVTLKNCAIALSNLALYGGGENQQEMAKHKVPEWLFPLAFVEDDSVRYYALLAIGVMVSNKEIENAVMSSGTLALVLPFIDTHDPAEFAQGDMSHRHGRSPGWLKRLIPVLSSKREEAQALAAFHFVMEAGIKSEQGRKEVLYKIGAVDPLKWLASTPNRVASKLAAQALKIIGEEIPHKLSQQVPLWTSDDVVHWIAQIGFGGYTEQFQICHVDGDLLLRLTEEELRDSLRMTCAITRKRFLRELRHLKISSDYTSCDPSMLGPWLREVSEDMSQYTYQMLISGVDRPLLREVTDLHLTDDCKIPNGIHRMKILTKIEELRSTASSPVCARYDSVDGMSSGINPHKPPIDVFISYRRSNGSQLASLLKVHLQLRGFTVFIDIEKLRAGKFDESLLESVRQAKNFIIVLTPNSLDRCMADNERKDWVHREITAAIEAGSNIIPLLDNFKWPSPESLPEDMRNVCYFNAIRWIHDYQDACVDKLEKFIRGETNPQQRHPASNPASNPSSSNSSTAATTVSPKQNSSAFESPNSPPYQRAQGLSKIASMDSPGDS